MTLWGNGGDLDAFSMHTDICQCSALHYGTSLV